jgi:ribosomal protein S18 acetylase RimI-like enzyme
MTVTALKPRSATHDDLPALHALIERGFRGTAGAPGWTHERHLFDGPRTDVATLAAIIDADDQDLLIAESDGLLIASVQISRVGDGTVYMGMLCVDPERQSGGLGGRMIAIAEAEAVARFGATRMEMTVINRRDDLIAYYGRLGYVPTGETRALPTGVGQLHDDLTLLVLAKPLGGSPLP